MEGRVIDPVIFEELTPELIQSVALKTNGAAGPSLLQADEWRRILGSKLHGQHGTDLSKSISLLAKTLCTEELKDPESLSALMGNRLIPLNKNPGLRPIGIGEVVRRIIGKAVTTVTKKEMKKAAGGLQLCVSQEGGAEAGIHSMVDVFEDESTEGVIQVDDNNAFNSINRKVLLHNITVLCLEIAIFVNNCYALPARLFVTGGLEISSKEGTTQGDPVAMPLYAIGILPLIKTVIQKLADRNMQVKMVAYADDITGAGKLLELKVWWSTLSHYGPFLGYHVNAGKSWLIVKPEKAIEANSIFADSRINITCEGRKHLGAVIGSETFKNSFVDNLVDEWIQQIELLSKIASTEPHCCLLRLYQWCVKMNPRQCSVMTVRGNQRSILLLV